MDTELLRTFIEVSKTRHFGRAAENLYLTQSAISFRIRQLEEQLGVSLFARHRNNIRLTASGERLLPYADAILHTLGRAKQDVALSPGFSQQLAIGAPAVFWELDFNDWLNQVYGLVPGLAIRLETASREHLCRQLLERTLDLALLCEPTKIDEIALHPVGELVFELVSRDLSTTTDDLMQMPHIHLDWGTHFELQPSPLLSLQKTPVLHSTSANMALQFVLTHGGAAYLPRRMVSHHLTQGILHQVAGSPALSRPLYLAYLEKSDRRELIDQLLALPLCWADADLHQPELT
ncbi:HTH-type transcriptional regulator HdfR [Aeromonas cavernicola]|uniref:HTH-type transcriptional regulator HdfR n=1 Tax=Aeromonas cavernicola TaxID=1006623 RepID=A0A2H9U1F6_9GAMM|nr:HTH-type transcriptional regulator HdfR [Aeromonas cavernicola]PJG57882.1 HTH-type transcriptional regulator HdfR [Aeromonas cavernicola]